MVNAYSLSNGNVSKIADELAKLVIKKSLLKDFVNQNLRPSGKYENFKNLPDDQFIAASWRLCAEGMNRILKVYGLGESPHYVSIDSASYDVSSNFYKGAIWGWSDLIQHKKQTINELFYQPTLDFSLSLLYLNHRDEVARYEPLATTENKKGY